MRFHRQMRAVARPVAAGVLATVLALAFSQAAMAAEASVSFNALPHGLSPWSMYRQADGIVKSVILILLIASFVTWTIWVAKTLELRKLRKTLRQSLVDLNGSPNLPADGETRDPIVGVMVTAAHKELALVSGPQLATSSVTERVAARLERIEAAAGAKVSNGTGILATIGSIAPFVGLFGTVWGIMNSFIGISEAKTTSLVVVAPGIAEALLATAIGLVAAIPAVLFFNVFAKTITAYRALLVDAATYISCAVSREVDRRANAQEGEPRRHVAAVR
ncbi:tonB-system energizer ExbB [Peristeroidobacter soli]|uniref:tonB-system energizer ExbB n=1 Tax=Peristeroidobacter soli TaxID=2497877 RepID=UPI001FE9E8A1|nr:tonB-system energizer ExbB [Peristeroidobacter soli]